MNEVGWAYWMRGRWELCVEEPVTHKRRQRVYLEDDVVFAMRAAWMQLGDVIGRAAHAQDLIRTVCPEAVPNPNPKPEEE